MISNCQLFSFLRRERIDGIFKQMECLNAYVIAAVHTGLRQL